MKACYGDGCDDQLTWSQILGFFSLVLLAAGVMIGVISDLPTEEDAAQKRGFEDAVLKRAYDRGYKEGMQE